MAVNIRLHSRRNQALRTQSKAITNRLKEPLRELVYRFQKKRERQRTPTDTRMGKLWLMQTLIL